MKRIRYIGKIGRQNVGTAEEPVWKDILNPMAMPWNEANEAIAKREAHKGEYEIVDDGQPEPVAEPTTEELLNAILGVTV